MLIKRKLLDNEYFVMPDFFKAVPAQIRKMTKLLFLCFSKVLKEIPVGDLQPDETVDAMHESSLLRNLDHPGIVKFHDSFVDSGFFCIVTEFCEVRVRGCLC